MWNPLASNGRLPSDSTLARYSALARSSSAKAAPQVQFQSSLHKKRSSFRVPFKPRSKSANRHLQKMANIGDEPAGSLSGYDASGSEVSSLARDGARSGARRRWFAHYDVQSTAFEFVNLSKLLQKNSRRSVIASGASAAVFNSALESEVGSEDELKRLQNTLAADHGDGRSNALIQSCPQFRNEIGGEESYSLTSVRPEASPIRSSHKPVVDGGKAASLMEDVPKPQIGFLVECPTDGQQYYKKYFAQSDHRNGLLICQSLAT